MNVNDDHPLVRHIHSLSTALSTQHTQLLHHSHTQPQLSLLSHQIAILTKELSALRAHSAQLPTSTDAKLKLDQLSLALRAVNEKLEFMEGLVFERTREVHQASAEVVAAKLARDAAYDVVESLYAKEREYLVYQTELQTKLRLEEEKNKSNELVIQEYAALVRKLEGRPSSLPSPTKEDHHQNTIDHLSSEFKSQTTALHHQLSTSHHTQTLLQTQLDAQTKVNQSLLSQLSELQLEVDKYQRDDNTASKMVSRYMKFSQQTTNTLQTTLTSLQSRHTSTLTSYTSQIHLLQTHLQTSPNFTHRDIHTQLLKESFGRRQETKFRLHLLRREEKLVEELKRWLRKNEERLSSIQDGHDGDDQYSKVYFMEMIQDAKIIIDHIDDPIQVDAQHSPVSGSLARFVVVQSMVQDLLERLRWEQERRMELEVLVGCGGVDGGRGEDGEGEGGREVEWTEAGKSSSINGVLEESTVRKPEREPGDCIDLHQEVEPLAKEPTGSVITNGHITINDIPQEPTARILESEPDEPRVDVSQDVESSTKEPTELVPERTYTLFSLNTDDGLEESRPHVSESEPDDGVVESKVDVSQEVESLTKEKREAVGEHIYPLAPSHTNNTKDVSEESTALTPERLPDDSVVESKVDIHQDVEASGESTAYIPEREPDDTIVEPKVDVHQEVEFSVKEMGESVAEGTYTLSSSNTNDILEESTPHVPEREPDDGIIEPKVDLHREVEPSVKETAESITERTHPLSSSYTNDTKDISEEPTARIPERLPDDTIAQPKVDVSQNVEFSVKETTEAVVEHTHPLSSSSTNDLSEESTVHMQVPIPEIVEPGEREEDAVIERVDTAKDEGELVVNEEVKDTDAGSIDQPGRETGDTQLEVHPSPLLSPSPPPSSENTKPPHPLLKPLHQVRNRYTHIQNSFHDCHIALENLKSHLTSSSSSPPTANKNHNIPYESIRTIVQRLDDYTEDVRVELEIRILDEEVLGRGYETLLMMCGGGEEWNEEEVLAFVNGTDPVIAKALKGFEKKLKDLEEDVAVVKKVVYSCADDDDNDDDDEDHDDNHKLKKKIVSTPESLSTDTLVTSPTPGWISSWISPSRSTTPIPQLQPPSQQPNLTFGKIMTNRPRLLSTSSSNLNSGSILRRTVSSLGLSSSHDHSESSMKLHHGGIHSRMTTGDVIKVLQLKTSMPELLVNRNELDVTEEEEDKNINNNNTNGVPFKPGLVSTFSSLGSTTPITATLKSSSFVLGMGMRGAGGGGGNRGLRGGRGMLGSVGLNDERMRRRVVSAAAAAPASSMVMKKMVDGGDKGKDVGKEDVD